ncbi:NIN-like protein [Artemisia annua]|uniref:NIN-like protein n=1 Tax=Artemisia annua TaxID=35608 RepID=A0A2U1MC67_ARTAN|nr:NIN-like protein [Artemisia annua]
MAYYGEDTSAFLESFPTYSLHSKPRRNGLWVFSSKNEGYENNSYSSDNYTDDVGTRMLIYEKIKSAFSKMDNREGLIVQFWAPVTIGGKHLLSTSGQPFAVSLLYQDFIEYRRRCVEYKYDIDVNSNNSKYRGTPASAFLNHFPDIASMHTSVHHEVDPLLRYAFQECGLENSFMIPICCPSQTSLSCDCIGVIECSSWSTPAKLFNEMNMNIKTIIGLKLARDQIQEALKIVCQSNHITFAQVWIASLDENNVHFSSSLEEAQTRQLLGLKLTGCIDERYCWSFQNYYDACDLIPIQPGEELVLKTLQDYEPRFCKNISHLGNYKLMRWGLPIDGIRSLTICMRSIHTGDFNYVFEFLWVHYSFCHVLLEELLLKIKSCLPSFKFASGAEIGDKLHVIEADNFTDKEIKKFDIFQLKRLSRIPEALKEAKKQVAVDYIVPLDRNCKTAPFLGPKQVIEQQFGTSTTENFVAAENIFGNGNPISDRDDERLSDFLETLPTYILHKKPETEGTLWVFCSEDAGFQKNLSSDDLGTRMIYDKIKSAFSKVSNSGELIVQFWAPVTSGNGRVLLTSGQPFAVSDFGEGLEEYRGRYEIEQQGDRHPMTMISGPPTNAFLSHLPEAVLDTKNHREGLLMRYASDCGLRTSYTLPIGCPSQCYSSCIGVVECSSISSINLEIVNTMNRALEQVNLKVFNVQDCIPYNTINDLKLVRDEIQVALKIVCESHNIGVAQVWISYEDENHVPFSFSSEDTQTTRMLVLKLTGYNSVNEYSTPCHWRFKEYYEACDMVPLKMGEELVEKTLQDYQPRFCENISQLDTNMLMAWVSTDDVACSGFTICMSIDSGDFSCAFEFIWYHNPNYVPLLEALLLMLKRHLPRFNFASGAELGDQLHVIDVDNSTESETKFFKIFKEKRLSPIPEAIDKGKKAMVVNYNARSKRKRDTTEIKLSREDIEQHYGKTMKIAAKELGVSLSTLKRKLNKLGMSGWQGPGLPQRKAYNSNKNQSNKSHTHEKDNGAIHDPSPVKRNEKTVIKAEYADDIIKLHLRISEATFVTVENEIGKKFKLKHGTFKIKYLDEDEEWILMTSDQDLSDCIQNSRNVDRYAVRLRVLLHNQ